MAVEDSDEVGKSALLKASWRLLPMIGLGYGIAYMDRVNIGFAALQMNRDLGFSAAVYGLGGGLFFLSYAALEVPSNLMLVRFGARRWIARIMATWGVLAVGMMFVTTPLQFYVMRFLLGAAEAGFFPGVVYYLSRWFPVAHRGRAISRFYVALPLSSVVMGALAGTLLGLGGRLGLAGWQWLFMAEGAPAIVLSLIVLWRLPDSPAQAPWLTQPEKAWIQDRLAEDAAAAARLAVSRDHGLARTLRDPLLWQLGIANLCILGGSYAFTLSAPDVLRGATHLTAAQVGYIVAGVGVLGALTMVLAGWHSDLRRERYLHTAIPLLLIGAAYGAMGLTHDPVATVGAYAVTFAAGTVVQTVFWMIPSELFRDRSAAIGVAAIGSIGMVGSFIGPYAWGLLKDHSGGYQAGLLTLTIPYLIAATIVLVLGRAARAARGGAHLAEPIVT